MADASIVFDSKKAEKFFKQITSNVKEISTAHRAYIDSITVFVFQDVMDHFNRQAGSKARWKGWSKLYAERMQKLGKGGNKILQDSGRLRQSFTPRNYRSKKGSVEWFNPARTRSGFPYAAAHDAGGDTLPQRDFMWLSTKALQRISQLTAAYTVRGA